MSSNLTVSAQDQLRSCDNCGKPTKNKRFCDRKCSAIVVNRECIKRVKAIKPEVACATCKKLTTNTKYCSVKCCNIDVNRLQREKYDTPSRGIGNRERYSCVWCKRARRARRLDKPLQPCRCYQSLEARLELDPSKTPAKHLLYKAGLKTPKCEWCGITEWRGQPAPLELDHIDGDGQNNCLVNLRILCCNCHAQTPTYKVLNWKRDKSASV